MLIEDTDRDADRTSSQVIEALAAAADTEPTALTPPLYRVVDTDALDDLVDGDPSVRVEFEYAGRSVVVRDGGIVEVDGSVYEPSRRTTPR